jgi:hypothetical protein
MGTTSVTRAKRKSRELPQHLRPLEALVELANLLDDEQVGRLQSAKQRVLEASGELVARASRGVGRTNRTVASLKEQGKASAAEMQLIFQDFSARTSAPKYQQAIAVLLQQMRMAEYVQLAEVSPATLFDTVALVRDVLRTVILQLAVRDDIVRLPEECYAPPAILRRVDDRIRVTVVPVSHWLLPMIDGLEAGRLGICEACEILYVARRRDQLGCSRKCGDTVYMRRYRRAGYRNASRPTASAVRSAKRRTNSARKKS